jgi:hypothetical protein
LKEGDCVGRITSSLNRYGEVIVSGEDRSIVEERLEKYGKVLEKGIITDRL